MPCCWTPSRARRPNCWASGSRPCGRNFARRRAVGRQSRIAPEPRSKTRQARPWRRHPPNEFWLLRIILLDDDLVEWTLGHLDLAWLEHPVVRRVLTVRFAACDARRAAGCPPTAGRTGQPRSYGAGHGGGRHDQPGDEERERILMDAVRRVRDRCFERELAELTPADRESRHQRGRPRGGDATADGDSTREDRASPATFTAGGLIWGDPTSTCPDPRVRYGCFSEAGEMAKATFWMPAFRTKSSTAITAPWVAARSPVMYTGRFVFGWNLFVRNRRPGPASSVPPR